MNLAILGQRLNGHCLLESYLRSLMVSLMAHRVLGVNGDSGAEDEILKCYAAFLMDQEKLSLAPWYVSRLPTIHHSPLFSTFLITSFQGDSINCKDIGSEQNMH